MPLPAARLEAPAPPGRHSELDTSRALGNIAAWDSGGARAAEGGTGGQIAKPERLQRLRESGALTDAEFDREKPRSWPRASGPGTPQTGA
jgi:hypothetical protein